MIAPLPSRTADRPEVSYTELEFSTATAAGLLRLAFMLDGGTAVPIPPGGLLDTDPTLQAKRRSISSPRTRWTAGAVVRLIIRRLQAAITTAAL